MSRVWPAEPPTEPARPSATSISQPVVAVLDDVARRRPLCSAITGRPAGLRLGHRDPEVLLGREDERPRRPVEAQQLLLVDVAEKGHVRRRARAQLGQQVSVADDDEALRQPGERLDDQIGPLVADEAADVEEVVASARRPA